MFKGDAYLGRRKMFVYCQRVCAVMTLSARAARFSCALVVRLVVPRCALRVEFASPKLYAVFV